jgi:glycosyltransferase involved in cell wall biosynthesis
MIPRPRPRILLLTEFFPSAPAICVFGAFQRLQSHVTALSRVGTVSAVFFFPTHGNASLEEKREWERKLRDTWPILGAVHFVPAIPTKRLLHRWVDALWALRGAIGFFDMAPTLRTSGRNQVRAVDAAIRETRPDLIFAHRLGGAAPLLRVKSKLAPLIIDFDDLDHIRTARRATKRRGAVERWRRRAHAALARLAMRRAAARASCTLVCSDVDRANLRALAPKVSVKILANTARELPALPAATTPTAVFVGIAHYPPNREAILWCASQIWPLVRAQLPDARLIVAGDGTDGLGIDATASGIQCRGFVSDLRDIYQAARIAVCPVRTGSGTRIKIIEAAINRRAVVSTSIGAEGLTFRPGEEIVLADKAAEFAAACVQLLQNPALAERMGDAAHARAKAEYSPKLISDTLVGICNDVLNSTS